MPKGLHMISMRLSQRPDGTDVAECDWNGADYHAASRGSVTRSLARQLIAEGAPDQPWQAVRGAMVCLRGKSLFAHAAMTLREGDHGFRLTRWRPNPKAAPCPRLVQALAGHQGTPPFLGAP